MGNRSMRWLPSACLLATGGLAAMAAVTAAWRPCAGMMLNGSVLRGYRYDADFSDACLATMDTMAPFPLPVAGVAPGMAGWLAVGAACLLAVGWLVLVPILPGAGWVRAVAVLPGGLVLAGVAASTPWLLLAAEVSVLAVLVLLARDRANVGIVGRVAIVGVAATAPGLLHQLAEYVAMIALSDANWDVPPGTGYLSASLCLVAAMATGWLWWRDNRRPAGATAVSAGALRARARTGA